MEDLTEDAENDVVMAPPAGGIADARCCPVCLVRGRDAAILHGDTSHRACHACAMRLYRTNGRCPICTAVISGVVHCPD